MNLLPDRLDEREEVVNGVCRTHGSAAQSSSGSLTKCGDVPT
ncbi:hypothetical protein ACIBHY_30920 [Nonomuraea sp. NPDC050547]